ncbi:YaeB-like protein, partial [Aduncisulcus paluster]
MTKQQIDIVERCLVRWIRRMRVKARVHKLNHELQKQPAKAKKRVLKNVPVTYTFPSGDVTVCDWSTSTFGPDDKVFEKNHSLWEVLTRGCCSVFAGTVKEGTKEILPSPTSSLRRELNHHSSVHPGLNFDLSAIHNGSLRKVPILSHLSGLHKFGYVDDPYKTPLFTSKKKDHWRSDEVEYSHIFTTKENGECCHISTFEMNGQWFWLIGSKNVHFPTRFDRFEEDIEAIKSVGRTEVARDIAITFFKTISHISEGQRRCLWRYLQSTQTTLCAEMIDPSRQHIQDYAMEDGVPTDFVCHLRFFGIAHTTHPHASLTHISPLDLPAFLHVKNVHFPTRFDRFEEDIEAIKSVGRTEVARDIAITFFKTISHISEGQRRCLWRYLQSTQTTLCAEMIDPSRQHIQDYAMEDGVPTDFVCHLRFFGIAHTTHPHASLTHISPLDLPAFLHVFGLQGVKHIDEVKMGDLVRLAQVEKKYRLMENSEGAVRYVLVKGTRYVRGSDAGFRPVASSRISHVYKDKNFWYVYVRACREKIKRCATEGLLRKRLDSLHVRHPDHDSIVDDLCDLHAWLSMTLPMSLWPGVSRKWCDMIREYHKEKEAGWKRGMVGKWDGGDLAKGETTLSGAKLDPSKERGTIMIDPHLYDCGKSTVFNAPEHPSTLVSICGVQGSGKSTVARALNELFGSYGERSVWINQDELVSKSSGRSSKNGKKLFLKEIFKTCSHGRKLKGELIPSHKWVFVDKINTLRMHRMGVVREISGTPFNVVYITLRHKDDAGEIFGESCVKSCISRIDDRGQGHRTLSVPALGAGMVASIVRRTAKEYEGFAADEMRMINGHVCVDMSSDVESVVTSCLKGLAEIGLHSHKFTPEAIKRAVDVSLGFEKSLIGQASSSSGSDSKSSKKRQRAKDRKKKICHRNAADKKVLYWGIKVSNGMELIKFLERKGIKFPHLTMKKDFHVTLRFFGAYHKIQDESYNLSMIKLEGKEVSVVCKDVFMKPDRISCVSVALADDIKELCQSDTPHITLAMNTQGLADKVRAVESNEIMTREFHVIGCEDMVLKGSIFSLLFGPMADSEGYCPEWKSALQEEGIVSGSEFSRYVDKYKDLEKQSYLRVSEQKAKIHELTLKLRALKNMMNLAKANISQEKKGKDIPIDRRVSFADLDFYYRQKREKEEHDTEKQSERDVKELLTSFRSFTSSPTIQKVCEKTSQKLSKIPCISSLFSFSLSPIGIAVSELRCHFEAPRQPFLGSASSLKLSIRLYNTPDTSDLIDRFNSLLMHSGHCPIDAWVCFVFDRNSHFRSCVFPPRERVKRGLFATRTPHRPNCIGLSRVRVCGIREKTEKIPMKDEEAFVAMDD